MGIMVGGARTAKEKDMTLTSDRLADYVTIGDMTIALPKGTPVGIAFRHPDDEASEITGKAIAFQRLMNESVVEIERQNSRNEMKKFFEKF